MNVVQTVSTGIIKAVLFDWGEVLIHVALPELAEYCSQFLGVIKDEFLNAFSPHASAFQEGRIAEDDLWHKICRTLGVQKPDETSLWGKAFQNCYRERNDMFDLVATLKQNGYITALVSNTERPVVDTLDKGQYDDLFDAQFFSCIEGIAKPHPDFYHRVLQGMNLQEHETVFIDDREENITGAKAVGMHGILFQDPDQVMEDLSQLGVLF